MIRAIVVDDEPLARAMLESYVKKTPFLELAGAFSSATDALEVLNEGQVDVAFLDIQMPDMTGLELSRFINTSETKVVFTTAFDKYAVEGFRVDAVDYLLKPISYADFLKAADRVRSRISAEDSAKMPHEGSRQTSIFIKSDYKMVLVEFSQIDFIESARDYVIINTSDGKKHQTQMTMKALETQLPKDTFLRVHRSFIVNLNRIKIIEQGCVVFGKTVIPVSDAVKENFYSLLSRKSIL